MKLRRISLRLVNTKEEFVETQSLDDLIQEMREAVEKSEASSEEVPSSEDILLPLPLDDEEQGLDPLLLDDENPTEMTEEVEEEQNLSRLDQEDSERKVKRLYFDRFGACISNYLCQCLLCLPSSGSFDQGN